MKIITDQQKKCGCSNQKIVVGGCSQSYQICHFDFFFISLENAQNMQTFNIFCLKSQHYDGHKMFLFVKIIDIAKIWRFSCFDL